MNEEINEIIQRILKENFALLHLKTDAILESMRIMEKNFVTKEEFSPIERMVKILWEEKGGDHGKPNRKSL